MSNKKFIKEINLEIKQLDQVNSFLDWHINLIPPTTKNKMKNIPHKIYLQISPDKDQSLPFDELGTTWCSDKINDTDLEYLLSSQVFKIINQLKNKIKQLLV